MDQFLAEYYGTDQGAAEGVADDDLEKMAQLTLLTKEAAAEGVDLSEFNDEELIAMADDLYGGGDGGTDEMEKEAAAKFEEADFLGRVMAHSFNQESVEIQKEAASLAGAKEAITGAAGKIGGAASRLKQRALAAGRSMTPTQVGARTIDPRKGAGLMKKYKQQLLDAGKTPLDKIDAEAARRTNIELGQMAKRRGTGMYAGAAAALPVAGGVGYGGYKGVQALREKKSTDSAFEQLVIERANEHLEAAGLLEKEAGEEDFETTVDRAALEVLEANGYDVEWY